MSLRALVAAAAAASVLCCAASAAPRKGADAGLSARQAEPLPASPGKPTAPIAIDFALGAEPAAGVALEIAITVHAAPDVGGLVLDARAADPAALLVVAQAGGDEQAGGARTWTVTVLPLDATVAYLSVRASGHVGGAELSRSLMIPVRTGGAKRAIRAAQAVTGEANGERLIVLPAEEAGAAQPR